MFLPVGHPGWLPELARHVNRIGGA
jgi:hypothetical protein